ncbi:sorbosone dehydrogenase family protein [Halomonas sp. HP20-15]|uniref:PQQ-dependent sugar dehydrogenase n=1 Tax=Halomonas sp. HP20-15 TaxID=3085901 RepID=UPI0029826B65|nr:sorbosone dehydrogenase family protein [Halomonas sp. HP20-15]MDW5377166.1 sorbosone dehydrogenase family protein [Halomonas sp. HP20-15]
MYWFRLLAGGCLALTLVACGDVAQLPVSAGTGPDPALPAPDESLIPTVNIAPAKGWPRGVTPRAAAGTEVTAFAEGLDHPRWIYVLPNGDVLVAETDSPPKESGGLVAWITQWVMKQAGSGGKSANRITLLRDSDDDGVADSRSTFLEGLNSPFGMALVGDHFYVANTDAVLRFPYSPGQTRIDAPGETLVELPAGPINYHWTKSLIAGPDGRHLYVGVGSNSNVGEKGMHNEQGRAAVWQIDTATGEHRLFATGLRNPVGMAWQARSGELWVAVNERDELGSDLVPDYMTALQEGGFYGWPYSYYGQHVDERVEPQRPELVERAIVPDYALGPHTASLGLASAAGNRLPGRFAEGMFVGQHGSWNRKPRSGYKVIFVPFAHGQPAGEPLDVLSGFVSAEGEALGRPVGVAVDDRGGLLVADDVGNTLWRVSAASSAAQ